MDAIIKTNLAERIERLITEARKRTVATVNTATPSQISPIPQTLFAESSQKRQIPSDQLHFTLSWSHYLKLMRIENPEERQERCNGGDYSAQGQQPNLRQQIPNLFAEQGGTTTINRGKSEIKLITHNRE